MLCYGDKINFEKSIPDFKKLSRINVISNVIDSSKGKMKIYFLLNWIVQ